MMDTDTPPEHTDVAYEREFTDLLYAFAALPRSRRSLVIALVKAFNQFDRTTLTLLEDLAIFAHLREAQRKDPQSARR